MAARRLDADASAAIEGLRGLAALMVVASHASGMGMHLLPGLSLEGIGKHGVYLFFVLSAFLLTAQWLQGLRPPSQTRPATRLLVPYLVRRVLRIYPLYGAVLVAAWALPPHGLGVPVDGAALWRHLTLREGRGIYWSVPVEFLYYLVIPPLAWWLAWARVPVTMRLGGLAALVSAVMLQWPAPHAPINGIELGYYLPVFLCGSAAAFALPWLPTLQTNAPIRRRRATGADVLVLLVFVASTPAVLTLAGAAAGPDALHRAFLGWGLGWAALVLLLVAAALPTWGALLRSAPMRACGRWCFGLYLLHLPALHLARLLPFPPAARGWAGVLLAVLLAMLAWRLVEAPALRLSDRLTRRA